MRMGTWGELLTPHVELNEDLRYCFNVLDSQETN